MGKEGVATGRLTPEEEDVEGGVPPGGGTTGGAGDLLLGPGVADAGFGFFTGSHSPNGPVAVDSSFLRC